jgi:hypothetical protein
VERALSVVVIESLPRASHGPEAEAKSEEEKRASEQDDEVESGERKRPACIRAAGPDGALHTAALASTRVRLLSERDRRRKERRGNDDQKRFQLLHS